MGTVRKVMHGPCPFRIQVIRYKIEGMQIIQRIEISRVLQKNYSRSLALSSCCLFREPPLEWGVNFRLLQENQHSHFLIQTSFFAGLGLV